MQSSRAHRHRTLLRAFMLGMLALCLLLRPVLASMGEVHELGHSGASVHAHDAGAHAPDSGDPADETGGGDRGDPMHTLLHLAHCCGHSPTTVPSAGMAIAPVATAASLSADTALFAPAPPAGSLLRPPIAA